MDYNAAKNILREGLRLLEVDNNYVSDNPIIYNTSNPWAKGDRQYVMTKEVNK